MNKYLNLISAILLLTSHLSPGLTVEGVNFPEIEKVQEIQLKLNGAGIRKATMFKVKVYAAALYLTDIQSDPAQIFLNKNPKLLIMKFLRDVEKGKINDAWDAAFEELGPSFRSEIKSLKGLMPDAKEGDLLEYVFLEDKTEFKVNHKLKGTMPGGTWGKTLLNTWIGNKPPTEELKNGLLGIKE